MNKRPLILTFVLVQFRPYSPATTYLPICGNFASWAAIYSTRTGKRWLEAEPIIFRSSVRSYYTSHFKIGTVCPDHFS
jgi:hypothetical protein